MLRRAVCSGLAVGSVLTAAGCVTLNNPSATTTANPPTVQPSPLPMTTATINPAPGAGVTLTPSTGVKTPTPTLSTPATAATGGYQTYTNRRFGYTVQIPANFTPGDPPANADGLEFSSPDRSASVSLAGENNALNQTVESEYAQAQQLDSQDGTLVTYKVQHGNVFTISGLFGSRQNIFYDEVFVGPRSIIRMEWHYPTAQKPNLDATIQHAVATFVPGAHLS